MPILLRASTKQLTSDPAVMPLVAIIGAALSVMTVSGIKHLRNNPDVQLSTDTRTTSAADGKHDMTLKAAEATAAGKESRLATLRTLRKWVWNE